MNRAEVRKKEVRIGDIKGTEKRRRWKETGRGMMDQTDSLMVLIQAKATVEMKASLHRYPAVTLTLGQSPTSDLMTPPA